MSQRLQHTEEEILELIKNINSFCKYDPETGELIATKQRHHNSAKVGQPLGSFSHGYLVIQINNQKYLVHRIVWLLTYGQFPKDNIDHINGNQADNRLSNLRDVTQLVNGQNRVKHCDNKSGVTGVYQNNYNTKWRAII